MSKPPEPTREGTIRLPDSRTLGYAVFGTDPVRVPRSGGGLEKAPRTAVWLHGTPGGRRQVPPGARAFALREGVQVIGIERPGIGASTPHLHADIRSFAHDVDAVLDGLGVERCAVIGLSGGGPYALACAHTLARVQACAVLGGVAPARGPEAVRGGVSTLASFAPAIERVHEPLGAMLSFAVRSAHPLASPAFDLFVAGSRPGDREVFTSPGMKHMFLDDMLRGSKTGLRSLLFDYLLFSRPWGFSLREVETPAYLWHGDADPFVPLAHGQHVADLLPNAQLTVQPGASHLAGLAIAEEVLHTVMAHV